MQVKALLLALLVSSAGAQVSGNIRLGGAINVSPPAGTNTTGSTSYCVANAGSDANDGVCNPATGVARPWRTLARAQQAVPQLKPGDGIYLNKGDRWAEQFVVLNSTVATASTTLLTNPPPFSGTAAQPITLGAYGTGAPPLIDGADQLTGLTWTLVTGTTWQAPLTALPLQLFVDPPPASVCASPTPPASPIVACMALNLMPSYTAATTLNYGDISGTAVYAPLTLANMNPNGGACTGVQYQCKGGPGLTTGANTQTGDHLAVASSTNTGLQNVEAWGNGSTHVTNVIAMPDGGSFAYDTPNQLVYVNLPDGSNPNGHTFYATHRGYGIYLRGVNHVNVQGIAVAHVGSSGIVAHSYADSSLAGNYWTNEFINISGNYIWGYGGYTFDYFPSQVGFAVSNGAASSPGGIVLGAGAEAQVHSQRGNSVNNNVVGYANGPAGWSSATGIWLTDQNAVKMYGNVMYSHAGSNFSIGNYATGVSSSYRMLVPDVGFNTAVDGNGNAFGGAGGRFHHNLVYQTYGQGAQLGGQSCSDGNAVAWPPTAFTSGTACPPQIIDHNAIYNTVKSANGNSINGFDCNGNLFIGVYELNNTISNTAASAISIEGGSGSPTAGCNNPHERGDVYTQAVAGNLDKAWGYQASLNIFGSNRVLYYQTSATNIATWDGNSNVYYGSGGAGLMKIFINTDCNQWITGAVFPQTTETNSTCSDPMLVDPVNGDLRLAAGSPAINRNAANVGYMGVGTADAGAIPYGSTVAASVGAAASPTAVVVSQGTTWYVRPDGGTVYTASRTAGQCDGKHDAAYPGTGTNQACAAIDPRYLYSPGDASAYSWIIAGGDTVLFRGGPWNMGYNSHAAFSNQATDDNSYMPAIPSGTAAQPTVLEGENYSSCATGQTQLYGGNTQNAVISVATSAYVQIKCLEITDHSQCVKAGGADTTPCNNGIVEAYAKYGVLSGQTSHDISLIDVNIHGLHDYGWFGATSGNLTLLRTKVNFNAQGGMSFDQGDGTPSSGNVKMSYSQINGNGCYEEYPIVHTPWSCGWMYDDESTPAGYGDAIGLTYSTMTWQVDHTEGAYNAQDMDWKYNWGQGSTGVFYANWFHDNMGNQLKFGAAAASWQIYNNLIGSDCVRDNFSMVGAPWGGTGGPATWFTTKINTERSGWNSHLVDFCRAPGSAVFTLLGDNSAETHGQYLLIGNTFYGYGVNGMVQAGPGGNACTDTNVNNSNYSNDCNTGRLIAQNNLFLGYTMGGPWTGYASPIQGQIAPTGLYTSGTAPWLTQDHNLQFNTQYQTAGTGNVFGDPKLVGQTQIATAPTGPLGDNITGQVASGSAAIGAGIPLGAPYNVDALGISRSASAPTVGAFEHVGP